MGETQPRILHTPRPPLPAKRGGGSEARGEAPKEAVVPKEEEPTPGAPAHQQREESGEETQGTEPKTARRGSPISDFHDGATSEEAMEKMSEDFDKKLFETAYQRIENSGKMVPNGMVWWPN